jgi:dolichyl-phosphate-mannose-protein mannosyltransferase
MARSLRRTALTAALPALVGASTVLHWWAGSRIGGLWIMPDEVIYADRGIALWRDHSLPVLHGEGAGYSVLYPIVAGLPLSIGSLSTGYASLKLLQALVVSLTAVPVFVYGRRIMSPGYALLGAALALSSPLLLYSGFVMTEVLYYPLATFALLAIARAIDTASTRDQVVALVAVGATVATRVQGVVLVAVFAVAILLEAAMARERFRLRRFWLVWALVAASGVVVALEPGAFGAYSGTFSGGYPLGASIRLVYDHLAYTVLLVAVAPIAALAILAVQAFRGVVPDRGVRALVAVATAAVLLVSLEVGLFAARYAPHLLGRDLAALPPILFLVFALWLARGSPRPGYVASVAILAIAAVVLLAPWNDLIENTALPDTMGIAPFLSHGGAAPATEVTAAVVIALLLVRFAPHRVWPVLPALVLGALAASTVSANSLVAAKVRFDQAAMVGTPRNWIDRVATSPVAYLFDGDTAKVNIVWQQRFWNRRISEIAYLPPSLVLGPIRTRLVVPLPDGRLPLTERYVVASDRDALEGTPVASQDRGVDNHRLVLWRLDGPPRLTSAIHGLKPNGDIIGAVTMDAYGCRGGSLQLTLLPKATDVVSVDLDGVTVLRQRIAGLDYWNGNVTVPPTHASDACRFTIRGGVLLGSTRIAFVRAG